MAIAKLFAIKKYIEPLQLVWDLSKFDNKDTKKMFIMSFRGFR